MASSTLEAMIYQEDSYLTEDYFCTRVVGGGVNVEVRRTLLEWMRQICHRINYNVETVEHASSIIDRYMLTAAGAKALRDQNEYQLAVFTALYISSKSHEEELISPKTLAAFSCGCCTAEELETMEWKMLSAINWRVNPPTSLSFVREIVQLLPSKLVDEEKKAYILEMASHQAACVIGEYKYLAVRKSSVAFAAVMKVLDAINNKMELLFYFHLSGNLATIFRGDWANLLAKLYICTGYTDMLGQDYAWQPVQAYPESPRSTMEGAGVYYCN